MKLNHVSTFSGGGQVVLLNQKMKKAESLLTLPFLVKTCLSTANDMFYLPYFGEEGFSP